MIKSALFDMDGLMFDTERIYDVAWKEAGKDYKLVITQEILNQMRGTNEEMLSERCKIIFGKDFNFNEFYKKTNEIARRLLAKEMPHRPGLLKLLDFLKANGVKMAVASSTNTKDIKEYVTKAGVMDYFDAIIGGDMVSQSKPFPEIFQKAAAALNTPTQHCIALEDSHNGIKSAFAAGCYTVMVPDLMEPTEEIKPFCNAIVKDLEQVIVLLAGQFE